MRDKFFFVHDQAVRHGLIVNGINMNNIDNFVNRVKLYSSKGGLTVAYLDNKWIFTVTPILDGYSVRYKIDQTDNKIAV